ncbi:MAG: DUF481 domain-containing protein [Acidobacteriota bacterium]
MKQSLKWTALWLGVLLFPGLTGAEEEERKLGWSDVAELTYVATGGNAEAETLGLRNVLEHQWEKARFELVAAALRAESTVTPRTAIGDGTGGFRVREDSESDLTAENYLLAGRYDRHLTDAFFWFFGARWERNEFAGFENRYVGIAGVGNVWFDDETTALRTDYGLTYTKQDDIFEGENSDDGYLGLRLSYDYRRLLTESTTFTNVLAIDTNFDETSDYRADTTLALAVAMSERLALKTSLQLLYDNQPALTEVDLVTPVASPGSQTVLVELDDLDSIFSVALVVSF